MACLVLWLTCMFTSDIKEDSQAANAYMLENLRLLDWCVLLQLNLFWVFILGNSNL